MTATTNPFTGQRMTAIFVAGFGIVIAVKPALQWLAETGGGLEGPGLAGGAAAPRGRAGGDRDADGSRRSHPHRHRRTPARRAR